MQHPPFCGTIFRDDFFLVQGKKLQKGFIYLIASFLLHTLQLGTKISFLKGIQFVEQRGSLVLAPNWGGGARESNKPIPPTFLVFLLY